VLGDNSDCKSTADFSTAAAKAPPSVEMTGFWVWEGEQTTATTTTNATATADFLRYGGKCAALGRNDYFGGIREKNKHLQRQKVKNAQRDSLGHPSRKTWLSLSS
jgi:hypothetical protein